MNKKRLKTGCLALVLPLLTSTLLAAGPQILQGHVPAAVTHMAPLGSLPETSNLNLAITLPLRNQAALSNLLSQIYDPASPKYHHYLTPQEFTEQFGPTENDYQAVIAFAQANGLHVTATWPNRALLDVSGTAGQVERALHLTLNIYRHPTENRNFYAPSEEPSLDLSVPVLHISGLDNFELPRPRLTATRLATTQSASGNSGSGPGGSYMGTDFRAAYVPDSARDGSGQMVGLLEFDGYASSDINNYESQAHLPNIPLQSVLIDGASGGPLDPGGADVEVALDIEVAISMATNLSKVVVYIAPNGRPFEDILNSMVLSNQVKQFSCSWYVPEGAAEPAADQIWQQMAAQGQSFLNASGDSCAYRGLIPFPGDSPYITEVGGTTLSTIGPGGAWSSETVWNWGTEIGPQYNGVGSSGGVSTQYLIPSWQTNISMTANQGSTASRNTPDVAMTGDNVYVRVDNGNYSVGGTSCAAPLWAGFMALVNQQAAASGKPSVGFINPALDAIGTGPNYALDFHDITTGNNTWTGSPSKFYAVTGYDLCTGWGTPAGQKLINDLANPEPLVISPTDGFVSTGGVGGPFTITSDELSLTNYGTNVLAWTLTNTSMWLNVSSSGGLLTPGGPATMVTVSLNNTASNLAVGSYSATLGFTNVDDGYGQGVSYVLNVIAPPTIISQPTNQAVLEGATALFTVSATGGLPLSYQWQLNGTNLVDGGNILGSQTSNLMVSDASDADLGDYSVTVTNLAGVAISSNATLSIVPSPPVITMQPANQTAVVDGTVDFRVSAVGNMPMSYQWSFDGTDIIGATNSVYFLSDVQLTNAGTYSVVITNELGSIASSNALLTVLPCDPAPPGIVAWWPAEGNANDIIGGNNGTPKGSLSYNNGEVGQAFVFDGYTSFITVPASASLNIGTGGGLTIECWINPSVTNANSPGGAGGPLIEWDSDDTDGCEFWADADNSLYVNIKDTSGNGHTFQTAGGVINSNVWQHVALTYDETSGQMNMYVNGNVVGSANFGNFTPQTTYPVNLGQRTGQVIGDGDTYAGMMDELSLYNRALSSNEITAIYNAGSAGKCRSSSAPPVIVTQPTNETVAVGETASFTVAASSTSALSYQWTFDGTDLTGANNAALTLTNVQPDQAGTYAVVVANVYGSIVSSNATLAVYGVPPFITTQPTNETVVVGGTASFKVVAGGSAPLSYQWSFDGTNLIGATNATLTLTGVQFSQAGIYEVEITNPYGSTNSTGAVLSVYGVPPFITTQPANQTVIAGGTATFSVAAGGSVPLNYQWKFDGTGITSATNSVLILTNAQPGESGDYVVTVANPYGSTNSISATLTVNLPGSCDPAPSDIVAWWPGEGNADDIIGTNNGTSVGGLTYTNGEVGRAFVFDGYTSYIAVPASPSLNIGTGGGLTIECWIKPSVTNSVLAGGAGGPLIEWDSQNTDGAEFWVEGPNDLYCNIKDISGNSHTFRTAAGAVSSNTWQHVALTYDEGSGVAKIYVNGVAEASSDFGSFAPQTTYPVNLGRRTGEPIGDGDTYAGMMDELSLYNLALSSNEIAAIYDAGSAGKCRGEPPFITEQPTNLTVSAANNAVFSVAAGGAMPLSYQWTFNGSQSIPGATNSALVLTNIQFANEGSYSVTVTNLYGSATSSNALLVVTVDHFAWNTIPSPRFVSSPFQVEIIAQDAANGVFTNYTGVVFIGSTNGVPVSPTLSSNFVHGVWTGTITVSRTATNLVLSANDGSGRAGSANPINIANLPQLSSAASGGTLYISWSVNPPGFVLESSTNLLSGTWERVSTAPLQFGGLYLEPITIAGTNTSVFYRLQFTGP